MADATATPALAPPKHLQDAFQSIADRKGSVDQLGAAIRAAQAKNGTPITYEVTDKALARDFAGHYSGWINTPLKDIKPAGPTGPPPPTPDSSLFKGVTMKTVKDYAVNRAKDVGSGILTGAGTGLINTLANAEHLASKLPGVGGVLPQLAASEGEYLLHRGAKAATKAGQEMAPAEKDESAASPLLKGIGEAIPGALQYAPTALMGPAAPLGMAAIGAVEGSDKGWQQSVVSGLGAGLGGKYLQVINKFPALKKALLAAGPSASIALFRGINDGKDPKKIMQDVVAAGGTMAALSISPQATESAISKLSRFITNPKESLAGVTSAWQKVVNPIEPPPATRLLSRIGKGAEPPAKRAATVEPATPTSEEIQAAAGKLSDAAERKKHLDGSLAGARDKHAALKKELFQKERGAEAPTDKQKEEIATLKAQVEAQGEHVKTLEDDHKATQEEHAIATADHAAAIEAAKANGVPIPRAVKPKPPTPVVATPAVPKAEAKATEKPVLTTPPASKPGAEKPAPVVPPQPAAPPTPAAALVPIPPAAPVAPPAPAPPAVAEPAPVAPTPAPVAAPVEPPPVPEKATEASAPVGAKKPELPPELVAELERLKAENQKLASRSGQAAEPGGPSAKPVKDIPAKQAPKTDGPKEPAKPKEAKPKAAAKKSKEPTGPPPPVETAKELPEPDQKHLSSTAIGVQTVKRAGSKRATIIPLDAAGKPVMAAGEDGKPAPVEIPFNPQSIDRAALGHLAGRLAGHKAASYRIIAADQPDFKYQTTIGERTPEEVAQAEKAKPKGDPTTENKPPVAEAAPAGADAVRPEPAPHEVSGLKSGAMYAIPIDQPDLQLSKGDKVIYHGTNRKGQLVLELVHEDGDREHLTVYGGADDFLATLQGKAQTEDQ